MSSPVRVLHLVAQLGGGGSERWVWDIVRLSDPSAVHHRVFPLFLDRGDFVYADRLAAAGVYRHSIWRPLLKRMQTVRDDVGTRTADRPAGGLLAGAWRAACYARASVLAPLQVMSFRPQVLHAHTTYPLIAALMLHRWFRIPVLHTVPANFSQLEDIGCGWMADLYRRRHRDIGLFLTGASRSELQSVGVPDEKILWSEAGLDIAMMDQALARRDEYRAAVRDEIGAAPNAPVALSIGRFHPSKGHRYAVEALPRLMKRHQDLHWVVLGAGAEFAALQQLSRGLGVANRAHFLGFRDDPYPYYAAADVYLRTPVYEAENLSSYQAMAAGLPVVGFDTGADTDLLRTVGHGRLVANRDSVALAEATADILALPDRGRSLGARGSEYARRRLDIRQTIAQFTGGYIQLANAKRRFADGLRRGTHDLT